MASAWCFLSGRRCSTLSAQCWRGSASNSFASTARSVKFVQNTSTAASSVTNSQTGRASVLDTFKTSQSVKVFLLTLRCGGVGLNLVAASRVILLDPWWNPAGRCTDVRFALHARSRRASDRPSAPHRADKERRCQAHDYQGLGYAAALVQDHDLTRVRAVEERILELQRRKMDLARSALSRSGARHRRFSDGWVVTVCRERPQIRPRRRSPTAAGARIKR